MTRSGVWILLVSLATPAAAQDVGSFSGLAQLVEAGDDVRVTLRGGRSLNARVAGVTPGHALSGRPRHSPRPRRGGRLGRRPTAGGLQCERSLARFRGRCRVRGVHRLRRLGVAAFGPRRGGQGPDGARRALRRGRRLGRLRRGPHDQAGGGGLSPVSPDRACLWPRCSRPTAAASPSRSVSEQDDRSCRPSSRFSLSIFGHWGTPARRGGSERTSTARPGAPTTSPCRCATT